ncbi:phage tail tape measure C-terminal domain-containing protein [Bartonella rattaustraliani]|uniref:phage tail tape measure C-terminal domain-containing protein n=1 Tax=Bartonella rattaustraliani TaxID=481139 RepID=UPI00031D62E2|nr:phage tail tape measure C-terminal domain-containing protein [Bartonella rattaustraliani]
MAAATKKLSIRLATVGGEEVRREFSRLGREGPQAFDKITHATRPANASLKAVDASARTLNGVFRQAATLVGVYAGISGISRSLGFIVSTNREFEKLSASLKTVTGSVAAADNALKMVEDLAFSTPFNVQQLTQAFIKLKALGLEPSREALASYGNTASAMGKDFMQFIEAIADAVTGEFERLKEFGIKASTQGEQVAFTFQGVTTTIGKNAEETEQYLRKIGQVQFAGAMSEQMKTLNGIISNIGDNFAKFACEVGAGGLNDALRDVVLRLKDATDNGKEAAHVLGQTLGNIVRVTADALGFLVRNADLAVQGLAAILIARTVSAAIGAMNVAILGNAGAIVGFRLMAQVSMASAAKMVLVEGAAKLATLAMAGLRSVMLLLGGPAGIIVLAGLALYKLAQGHDAAGKAAKDHAAEMEELRASLKKTTDSIEELNTASRNEALARLTEKLQIAQENICDVTYQLQRGEIGGFWDQFSRVGTQLNTDLAYIRRAFIEGKISVDQYQEAIWALAVKYPDFTKNAKQIQEQVLALKAAELAAKRAGAAIDQLRSGVTQSAAEQAKPDAPQAPPQPVAPKQLDDKQEEKIRSYIQRLEDEKKALKCVIAARSLEGDALKDARILNEQEQVLRRLGIDLTKDQSSQTLQYAQHIRDLIARKYELEQADQSAQTATRSQSDTVKEITRAYNALKSETEQATLRAIEWREEALRGLDATSAGYATFRAQVEEVFQHMLREAREKYLENSKYWADGLKRGFQDIVNDAQNMAAQTENLVKNAFKGMEDALVSFVTTGKLDFKSLIDSIIADLVRLQIRNSIIGPLADALGGFNFGSLFGLAHTGGVIGSDALESRSVNPALFSGAHKFHSGGIVGNEVSIIAKRGETVFTPGQMRLLSARIQGHGAGKVEVHVHNNAAGIQAKTQASQCPDGGSRLDIIIEQIESQMTRNVARGEGLAPTLGCRYGLNPAAGSYR